VAKIDPAAVEPGPKHIRGAGRLNSRVPIVVDWEEGGKALQTFGYTMDVSTHGCMAILEHGFPAGQKVRLTNRITGQSVEATVIWRGHQARTGWEMGLELEKFSGDFWGIDF